MNGQCCRWGISGAGLLLCWGWPPSVFQTASPPYQKHVLRCPQRSVHHPSSVGKLLNLDLRTRPSRLVQWLFHWYIGQCIPHCIVLHPVCTVFLDGPVSFLLCCWVWKKQWWGACWRSSEFLRYPRHIESWWFFFSSPLTVVVFSLDFAAIFTKVQLRCPQALRTSFRWLCSFFWTRAC